MEINLKHAPELRGLTEEEMHFFRPIDARIDNPDGSVELRLTCGHETRREYAPPASRRHAFCWQCMLDSTEAEKKLRRVESTPSIVCPQCGVRSYSPKEVSERFCANCHQFHDDMSVESAS